MSCLVRHPGSRSFDCASEAALATAARAPPPPHKHAGCLSPPPPGSGVRGSTSSSEMPPPRGRSPARTMSARSTGKGKGGGGGGGDSPGRERASETLTFAVENLENVIMHAAGLQLQRGRGGSAPRQLPSTHRAESPGIHPTAAGSWSCAPRHETERRIMETVDMKLEAQVRGHAGALHIGARLLKERWGGA
jgi:hypothetical protein